MSIKKKPLESGLEIPRAYVSGGGGIGSATFNYIRNHANPIDIGNGVYGQKDSRQAAFDVIWNCT